MVSPNNRDLSGPERELSSVTPEMIEAGRKAIASRAPYVMPEEVEAIYEAMRAVDPEWVKMREALLSIATNAWSHQDDREIASDALQETSNNGISAWSEADFEDRFK